MGHQPSLQRRYHIIITNTLLANNSLKVIQSMLIVNDRSVNQV